MGVVHLLDPERSWEVYRVITAAVPQADDFRSAYELGHPPPRRIQLKSAAIWMAISTLTSLDAAASRAKFIPQLGSHVARLILEGGNGFAAAETVESGHISVWGDPFKLEVSVADVYPVSDVLRPSR